MEERSLTHVGPDGKTHMVDVQSKAITPRRAVAEARVWLPDAVRAAFDGKDFVVAKGPVIDTARLAGIMGAKETGRLIPLCHPLAIDFIGVTAVFSGEELILSCEARSTGKTGVEMEALTGASIAALTIYDMCKALSHDMEIRSIRLMEKTGGKNDFRR